MVGPIPMQVYQDYHVDKAFIGIGGISLEDGFTEYNIEDTQIKRMLIHNAREKIVVADGAKFGVTTISSESPLTAVDKIVTDKSAPVQMIEKIRKKGVEVILAD
jgi:DeoR/GlpR family transcriptional regulator of sugar metabolism